MANDSRTTQTPDRRPPTEPVEACVHAGSTITGYHRLGSGPPVLLLRRGNDPIWRVVLPVLAEHYRLLVPRVPEGEPDFDGWLRGFLDGLGVDGTRAIADHTLASQAVAFARAEPDRIERLALLTVAPPAEPPPVSLLIVNPAEPGSTVTARVLEFFA